MELDKDPPSWTMRWTSPWWPIFSLKAMWGDKAARPPDDLQSLSQQHVVSTQQTPPPTLWPHFLLHGSGSAQLQIRWWNLAAVGCRCLMKPNKQKSSYNDWIYKIMFHSNLKYPHLSQIQFHNVFLWLEWVWYLFVFVDTFLKILNNLKCNCL